MDRCFADIGKGIAGCSALNKKYCEGCAFFKTVEQKRKDDDKTKRRLDSMKDKVINILY